jgi:hypothetical protein
MSSHYILYREPKDRLLIVNLNEHKMNLRISYYIKTSTLDFFKY